MVEEMIKEKIRNTYRNGIMGRMSDLAMATAAQDSHQTLLHYNAFKVACNEGVANGLEPREVEDYKEMVHESLGGYN